MIVSIIIIISALIWLGIESDWLMVNLVINSNQENHKFCIWYPGLWIKTFKEYMPNNNYLPNCFSYNIHQFIAEPDYSEKTKYEGYVFQTKENRYKGYRHFHIIELGAGLYNNIIQGFEPVICGIKWLDKHWNDLADFEPQIELLSGNGYKQTMTFRTNEDSIIKQAIKNNTGKKFFKSIIR
jgi:hypothetical protein